MDTLTHALSGALLARAGGGLRPGTGQLPVGTRTLTGFLAAAFPDGDYVLNFVDPLLYLNWHRGYTHSLLLLPLWAALLATLFHRSWRRRWPWRAFFQVCAASLAIHIAGDVITTYGTRIWVPLSEVRVSLPTTFIVDPWFTGILVVALLVSAGRWRRAAAVAGFAVLGLYVGLQAWWHQEALSLARAHATAQAGATAQALPQPFSPLNWKLVVTSGDAYQVADVRLHGRPVTAQRDDAWWRRQRAVYRAPDALQWRRVPRFGEQDPALARRVWSQDGFARFRSFAGLPVVYRVDKLPRETCVWFTDLRFVLDRLTPPFRYGMCRESGQAAWTLRRMPR